MKLNKSFNEARKQIANDFIKGLDEQGLKWFSGRRFKNNAMNGQSQKTYNGYNHFRLIVGDCFADTRYWTFKQATDKGYKVKKGQVGKNVGFFSYYDKKNKKTVSYEEYEKLEAKDRALLWKEYNVFNSEQLEGIELEEQAKPEYDISLIENIAKAMNLEYEVGTEQKTPCYIPSQDKICLPNPALYKDKNVFMATALHELSHSTGHKSRLNRDLAHNFGSNDYAFEELVAEMSSALLCSYYGIENSVSDNHKAYVKSWIKYAKDKPQTILEAFKLAEQSCDYIINLQVNPVEVVEKVEEKKAEKKIAKATSKTQKKDKGLKKAPRPIMGGIVKDGVEYITFTLNKEDGNTAYVEIPRDYYFTMNKKDKSQFKKAWGIA